MKLKAQEIGTCVLLLRADAGFDDETELVAEVHSGLEDAKHIAECVNAAAAGEEPATQRLSAAECYSIKTSGVVQGGVSPTASVVVNDRESADLASAVQNVINKAEQKTGIRPDLVVTKHRHAAAHQEPFGYFRAEPFGWTDCAETDEGAVALYDQETVNALQERCDELLKQRDELLEALELQERQNELAAKQQWIDPNDKTQSRYLPHIGEPVLFCHQGKTYYGLHTGGSFKAGHGVTAKLFGTWDCMWMPLPEPADTQKGDAA